MKYSMFIGRWQPWHPGHRWLIDQRLNENKNVLDVACGNGVHSIFLANKGWDVSSVDIKEKSFKTYKTWKISNHLNMC